MTLHDRYMISTSNYMKTIYDMYLGAGTDEQNQELAIENMILFYPHMQPGEFLEFIRENKILEDLFEDICEVFATDYLWIPKGIAINNKFQHTINSYAFVEKMLPMFMHIDQLLESVTLSFCLTMFKWVKAIENDEQTSGFFPLLLDILHEVALLGELPGEFLKLAVMEKIDGDTQIQNLAADCHWAMLTFTMGHEMAHMYQIHTNPDYWTSHPKEAEINADCIGYDILLKLIMKKRPDTPLEEYTYLSPMMYMDLFDLMYYTDQVLYQIDAPNGNHPLPEKRKEYLFNLVDGEQYILNTEEGNAVYQGFCMAFDQYKEILCLLYKSGQLDKIIDKKRRMD